MRNDRIMYNIKECGYVTLLAMLIVSAVGTTIATSLILYGLGTSRSSFADEQSHIARWYTDACVEEALAEIRDLTSYTGSDSLSFDKGDCSYTVTNTGGENRTINATGTVGSYVRAVKVTIDTISPQINVTSWQSI